MANRTTELISIEQQVADRSGPTVYSFGFALKESTILTIM